MVEVKDWSPIVLIAQTMIAQYGRAIDVLKLSSTPADSVKPWRGPGQAGVADIVSTIGVFVPPTGDEFGRSIANEDMLARIDQIALIGQTATDIEKYDVIIDSDGLRYKVEWSWVLKPGSVIILYAFGVCR